MKSAANPGFVRARHWRAGTTRDMPGGHKSRISQVFRRIERFLGRHPQTVIWSVLAAGALVALTRRPETVTEPQFWAEDGKYWYADAYNHGPFEHLFYLYGGYFVPLYRLVASVSLLLPFHVAPLFFNLVALGVMLLPLVLINSSRLRHIIPYRSLALLISFIYIAVPNGAEVFANLTNIQWHLGFASLLVLLAQPAKTLAWRIFDIGILVATGLSGPLVIMLFPIAFFLWWRERKRHHFIYMAVLAVLSVIQAVCIFLLSSLDRVGGQPDADLLNLIKMIVGQVFMGGILGQKNVDLFYGQTWALVLVLMIGLSLVAYAVIKGPLWLKLFNAYSLILIVSMLVSLKPTKDFDTWWGLTNPGGGQRYWYIPILVWLATLLWLALAARQRVARVVAAGALVLLFAVGIPQGWRIAPFPDLNFPFYAQQFEQLPRGAKYSVPINPAWEMVLIKK
jgi:hypothetical protein